MAKNSRGTSTPTQSEQNSETKRQKKQAKKEAKMMLAIEQEKDSLEKAQDKLARAQARVEAHEAHLRNLEAKLAAYRTSPQPDQAEAPDSGFDHQQGQPDPQELPAEVNASTHSPGENNHTGAVHEESEASPTSPTEETADSPMEEPASSDSPAEAPATSDEQSGETSPSVTVAKRPRITRRASTDSTTPDSSPAPVRRAAARGRSNTNKTTTRASKSDKGE